MKPIFTNLPSACQHILTVLSAYTFGYLLFFSPALMSSCLIAPGDAWLTAVPAFFLAPAAWSQYLMCGSPWIAELQRQTFYPPHMLFALAHLWNTYVVSAYVLASCFAYGFTFSLTRSRLAAAFAGLVYGLSGYLVGNACHQGITHAAAYLPLLLWALHELKDGFQRKWFAIGTASVALSLLCGHTQTSVYSFVLTAFYAVFVSYSNPINKFAYLRTIFLILLLGVLISTAQLLPTLELTGLTPRAHLSFNSFDAYSLEPVQLLGLIFPQLLGAAVGSPYGATYFGWWDLESANSYVGLLPLLIASLAVVVTKRQPTTWFWLAVMVLSLLLALGGHTPLGHLMYVVPVINKFRCPSRHLLELTLSVSVLAGYGIAALEKQAVTKRQAIATIFGGVFVLVLSFILASAQSDLLLSRAQARGIAPELFFHSNSVARVVPPCIFFLDAIVLFIFLRSPSVMRTKVLLIAMSVLDLGSMAWFCQWHYGNPPEAWLKAPTLALKYKELLTPQHQRVFSVRGMVGSYYEIPPDVSALWDVPSAGGYTPLMLQRYCQLMDTTIGGFIFRPLEAHSSALNITCVRYLFVPRNDPSFDPLISVMFSAPGAWKKIEDLNDAVSVYENMHVMPRAWLAGTAISMDPDKILTTIRTSVMPDGSKFDPAHTALIESSISPPLSGVGGGTVEITRLENETVELKTNAASTSILVLSDTNYPGWIASVDKAPANVLQTDYILRGVIVGSGEHTVRFRYLPACLYIGMFVSLAALALASVITFFVGRTTRLQSK